MRTTIRELKQIINESLDQRIEIKRVDVHERGLQFLILAVVPGSNCGKFTHLDNTYAIEGIDPIDVVGKVEIRKSANGFYGTGLEVAPEYRRRGIATRMYDYAEGVLGRKLTPEFQQTEDGIEFWKSRR